MSLFEKVKNIRRNNLQEKRKFPGDESGAYKQAKDDLEARKGFKKNKPGGLKADEKNPYVKRSVRKSRVDKLGGDIYDAPKFSQKGFEKSLKKFSKGPRTGIDNPFMKSPAGDRSKTGDTPGQIRVKGLERKAFKKTKPSDIKLPKSFTDFERNLQDYKDRDLPGGPRKTTTKPKTSGTPLTRQDVGMAPPDKPKTKVVKQSEVSKKAQEFTKNINQKRQTTTPSKSDVERIKQNKIDTQKADAFKKTAAYKNIAQGKDSKGNYLSKEQRKANFIKQTKQNKVTKNKTVKFRKDKGTYKTAGGNRVTTGAVGARQQVTFNKDFAKDPDLSRMSAKDRATYQSIKDTTKKGGIPKWMKNFDKKYPMKSFKKAATPAATAFSKAGPVGKLATAALGAGALIYGANQVRKAFAGAGKPKAPPVVKGSALRYNTGPKKGQKKYFDIKTMKRDYFTKSDFRDNKGNIDAGFGKPDRDEKLIKRLKSTK